jgi:isoleucyl-tRNA synthetase
MLATFAGLLALPLGLALVLLPLLATELSRPRDSSWGGVVLLLGLVLVTSAERLSGAPMLAVLSGGLLIGRLGLEVGQGRWRQLSPEEQQRLGSLERWTTSLGQLGITLANLAGAVGRGAGQLGAGVGRLSSGKAPAAQASGDSAPSPAPARAGGRAKGKRWVRPEPAAAAVGPEEPDGTREAGGAAEAGAAAEASKTQEASETEEASAMEEDKNLTARSAPASPTAQPADVEPATASTPAAAAAAAAPSEAPSEAS